MGEEHHVIHTIVQQMQILTLAITNTHKHKHTYTPRVAATDSVDVILIDMTFHLIHYRNVHFPYKVLFLTFPQHLQPLYGGFYTWKSKSKHCSNKSKVPPLSHAAVSGEIPFSTIKILQFYSLFIVMCIGFIIDVRPSRDCVECSDPI